MRCARCGFSNIHGAKFCSECGSPMEMPVSGRQEKQNPNRKVIKLPSDMSNEPTTPIERPWEVRVPKRESNSPAQDNTASTTGAAASSAKGPTPRRRTGSTGRIPAIKHPANESGKIPVEERASTAAAKASTAGKPSPSDTAPILIDDLATPNATVAGTGASTRPTPRPRRSTRYDAASTSSKGAGKKRVIAIIIAILVVCCIVAFGIFFSNPANNTKTVSFDTDGGTVIGNQYILDNGKLERPANPTRPGYVFDGWYYDADYNDEVSFPVDITQDMTLYAKWKEASDTTTTPDSSSSTTTPDVATPGASAPGSPATGGNSGSSTGSSGATSGGGSSGTSAGNTSSGGSSGGNSSGSTSGGSTGGGSSSGSNLNGPGVSNGTVNVSMVSASGRTLTGTVTLHDGYVIPNSSEKAYSVAELRALGLNDAELCIARNEPYARMGYSFRNPGLQAYFNARSWYHNKGWQGELPQDSAGYITAHNLLAIAEGSSSAAQWLRLRTW